MGSCRGKMEEVQVRWKLVVLKPLRCVFDVAGRRPFLPPSD